MSLTDLVFAYCERGQQAHIMAEPLNVVTNLGFLLAAFMGWVLIRKQPPEQRAPVLYVFTALVFLIGLGSALFHSFATRWSELADVLPITIFMLTYLGFAIWRLLGWRWLGLIFGFALFFAAGYGTNFIHCESGPCLNGTIAYAPAWLALFLIGFALIFKAHPAGKFILIAGVVFTVSAIFRSLDFMACDVVGVGSYQIGTHFLWHIFNAVVLYLLLRAAILYGYKKNLSA